MDDCVFCKIVRGEIPSYKIFETEEYLAFLDIYPSVEGYTVIIPKKHYRWVWDVEDMGGLFDFTAKIANHYKEVTGEDAIYASIMGEEVPHAHVKIYPANDRDFNGKLAEFSKSVTPNDVISQEKAIEVQKKFKLNEN